MKPIRAFVKRVFDNMSGFAVSGMIYLGHHLGLYRALQDAGPVTSDELASRTRLHERWVREWLYGQAAAGLLDYAGEGRFALSPVAALALANEQSPAFVAGAFVSLPQMMGVLEQLRESFATGIGLPYDAFGSEGARGVEGMLAPWFRTMLVPIVLPRLDGVVRQARRPARRSPTSVAAPASRSSRWPRRSRARDSTATTSRGMRSIALKPTSGMPGSRTSPSTMRGPMRCRQTPASTSSRPSTVCTT